MLLERSCLITNPAEIFQTFRQISSQFTRYLWADPTLPYHISIGNVVKNARPPKQIDATIPKQKARRVEKKKAAAALASP